MRSKKNCNILRNFFLNYMRTNTVYHWYKSLVSILEGARTKIFLAPCFFVCIFFRPHTDASSNFLGITKNRMYQIQFKQIKMNFHFQVHFKRYYYALHRHLVIDVLWIRWTCSIWIFGYVKIYYLPTWGYSLEWVRNKYSDGKLNRNRSTLKRVCSNICIKILASFHAECAIKWNGPVVSNKSSVKVKKGI